MNIRKKPGQVVSGTVAALSILSYAERPLEATAPAGVTFTVLNRATVPEFDARRRYRQESDERHQNKKVWKIELEATRMVEVWTVLFTVQPGGHSGWHTHPGPAVFTVSAGTLTMYDGDDPSCTPQPFPAGTGSIEADSPAHNHLLRNETNSVAQTIVTFIVPVGAPIRTDLPDPGNCSF
jgi:mannose-6-phosphate isomerase-like protein (cupin superfamily)